MQGQQNQQHSKIVKKLLERYGNPKLSVLNTWLAQYTSMSPETINTVAAKLQTVYGYDDREYSEEQLKVFILIAVAAQKGKNMTTLDLSQLGKYKKHSFKMQSLAPKQKQTVKPQNAPQNSTQKGLEGQEHKAQSPKDYLPQSKQAPQVIKLKPNDDKSEVDKYKQQPNLAGQNPFKKKREDQWDVSKSPVPRLVQAKINSPPSKPPVPIDSPSKPTSQKVGCLQQSISTKMVVPIKITQKPETKVVVPELKALQTTSPFLSSQISISKDPKKDRKVLQITINKHHKFVEGWSTVIKYQIVSPNEGHPVIFRRFSQFSKLLSYLSDNHKGAIIPELPPKQYFGGAIWTPDNKFYEQRRLGLELFLNKVLAHDILGTDPLVLRFIDDQSLDESNYGQGTLISSADKYLKTLLSITKSTSQLKDYGMAYYTYVKSSVIEQIPSSINTLITQIRHQQQKFNSFKVYVDKVDTLYATRSQVEAHHFGLPEKQQQDKLKKQLHQVSLEFSEAKTAFDAFCKLKAQVKWYQVLTETKKNNASTASDEEELRVQLDQSLSTVQKVTPILEGELTEFLKVKQSQWRILLQNIALWKARKNS